jgi:hypothetical protein
MLNLSLPAIDDSSEYDDVSFAEDFPCNCSARNTGNKCKNAFY